MGQVITFYSFKGGVGRTMALANIAILLAEWGKKVLVVDWDLEAPGLEHYFSEFIDPKVVVDRPGVLDLLSEAAKGRVGSSADIAWRSAPLLIPLANQVGKLEFIGSGRRDDAYFSRLRSLDVDSLYTEQGGGLMMERVRDSWKERYDYVLLDSRTGITDIGGICTIHLPDVLVLMFTATEQSLAGVIDVARRAGEQRQKLPFDRLSLNCLPIPSRFDTLTEHRIAQEWLDRFASDLDPLYREWLPLEVNTRQFLESSKIPYVSYFSFGERLAVREQGTTDPAGLGYAYESVAALLGNDLAYADQLLRNRDRYVRSAAEPKPSLPERLDTSSELALLLVEPDRSTAVGELLSGARQDALLLNIREELAAIAANEGGEALSAGDDSYVFQFRHIDAGLRSALAMQKRLAVNPVRRRGETAKARMGLHGATASDIDSPIETRHLLRATATISRNAKAGQLIVSDAVQQRFTNDSDWVRFKPAGSVESDEPATDPEAIETFEAIGITRVTLNPEETELLFEQDPSTRSEGGFQNFLVKLQEKTDRASGKLDLTISDLERIARLAFDYRQGGWQNQLRRIFGRVLGDTLGRDAQI
jgi:cellulose biosynthesis protein BcsQ